jgi:glycosyltransferase involved in cell wall biosynthesis
MRLGVYTDYAYHRVAGEVYAERAFALFLARLAPEMERLVVIGRLDPQPGRARYRLADEADFIPLPFYPRLSSPLSALRGMAGSLSGFWHALGEVDAVWLLGPHPLIFVFAAAAMLRRKRVVLGVRQNLPDYVRMRHPGNAIAGAAARLLEAAFRILGRFCDVVAVGPAIAHDYRHSQRVLEIAVSLVEETDLVEPNAVRGRDYGTRIDVLSVGRLDVEKNPLLLADVLARLSKDDPRWHLIVCGEGPLQARLAQRLLDLGLADRAELRGYLTLDDGLRDLYRDSHAFLHVSWTEGLPQVVFEGFAAALPVVATDVGGIAAAVGEAARLIPPGNADAAADALRSVASDAALRKQMIEAGHRLAATTTIDVEARRVAEFISEA